MGIRTKKHDLDTSAPYKTDNPLLKLTLQKKYLKEKTLGSWVWNIFKQTQTHVYRKTPSENSNFNQKSD